ncbi:MAG TPA: hypothetical protein DDW76_30735 [Cyanobacteria bacterium UBA11369]|nr:hypothetical protein [Cyanobacteria bacterium UBA11371]HBE31512.1 hypothetical protein [Cyanobacteria bacterium UBA11368]HBE53022.1 hypothetical protein [Cyanobacteria bacterium UBA11369]
MQSAVSVLSTADNRNVSDKFWFNGLTLFLKDQGFVILELWLNPQNRVLTIERFEVLCNKAKFLKAKAAEKLENTEIPKMVVKQMLYRA